MLPDKLFFTGVPGSKWSGISQILETIPGFNTSDRTEERSYRSGLYSGHVGAYFGEGMELSATLDDDYINTAWKETDGCKIVKSHDWAYCLDTVKKAFPEAWIMMVYRPDMISYAWWHEAGGFNISYPDYSFYKNSQGMMSAIMEQNRGILEFGAKYNATWRHFSASWCKEQFGKYPDMRKMPADILVTVIQ